MIFQITNYCFVEITSIARQTVFFPRVRFFPPFFWQLIFPAQKNSFVKTYSFPFCGNGRRVLRGQARLFFFCCSLPPSFPLFGIRTENQCINACTLTCLPVYPPARLRVHGILYADVIYRWALCIVRPDPEWHNPPILLLGTWCQTRDAPSCHQWRDLIRAEASRR